jgi:hypothetical protein
MRDEMETLTGEQTAMFPWLSEISNTEGINI